MSLEKVLLDLKKGKVAPCYLLYGEEEYLIQEALGDILDLLVPASDRDFGLFFIDGSEADFDLLRDRLSTPSLLGGAKVVVVKNTEIFQSKENLGNLIQKIRENLGEHPDKAVRSFQSFLKLSGFAWEDLQGGGWQKITDEQWRRAVEDDPGEDRHKWLPRIVEICAGRGMTSGGDADISDSFEKLLADGLPAGNCLILTAEAVDRRKKIFKVIDKKGVILHFGAIKGEAATRETLKSEARRLLQACGKSLTSGAWAALGKKTGFQLRPSLNELEKLIVFAGEKPVIGEEDVEAVVEKTREDRIFDLTNALGEKNAPAALLALQGLLDQGEPPLMILSMVSIEIRMLLQASILVQSGKLPPATPGMEFPVFQKKIYPAVSAMAESLPGKDFLPGKNPYVIYKALGNCRRFSYPVLLGYLEDLVEMDRSMKSSATDPRILLERFLIKACA
ncbi:MAG: DNA polymerase III subunit delta [Smithellaceae bacterium]|jgi:DNA polymerase-3 subunit delta|nr:DNA polymerase III subunit delta [Smithellaceae bacterium]MDD3259918.1 DNA polymerase III subunit delta [Smithellaceae bacterium]MDD3849600.1 DNA polymerase III subunit delta [Smithellaceae bacterium]HOG12854.1 DNA polymerase III subunit delta [Smithellaceae bacterium]